MRVALECPHCRRQGHTLGIVQPGKRLRCPKCGEIFRPLPDGKGLAEAIALLDERTGPLVEDRPLPRSRRSAALAEAALPVYSLADTPRPPGPPSARTILASPKKVFTPGGCRPVEQARSFIGVLAITPVVMAVMTSGYWYIRQVSDRDASAVPPAGQRQMDRHATLEASAPMPEIPAARAVRAPDNERVPPSSPVERGGYGMSISAVEIGPVKINNVETRTRHLTVYIEVRNRSQQPVEYRGWHDARTHCSLKGPRNRNYSMFLFARSELPEGCVRTVRLQPGATIRDMIVFEDPGRARIASLELELPPLSPLAPQPFRFIIPGEMIGRRSAQSARMIPPAMFSATPSVPPTGAGASEEERIRAEADRKWRDVEKAARRMSRADGIELYKRERVRIRDELYNKHRISRDELRRIAPYLFKG